LVAHESNDHSRIQIYTVDAQNRGTSVAGCYPAGTEIFPNAKVIEFQNEAQRVLRFKTLKDHMADGKGTLESLIQKLNNAEVTETKVEVPVKLKVEEISVKCPEVQERVSGGSQSKIVTEVIKNIDRK
jgi:hypothetical protein